MNAGNCINILTSVGCNWMWPTDVASAEILFSPLGCARGPVFGHWVRHMKNDNCRIHVDLNGKDQLNLQLGGPRVGRVSAEEKRTYLKCDAMHEVDHVRPVTSEDMQTCCNCTWTAPAVLHTKLSTSNNSFSGLITTLLLSKTLAADELQETA